MCETLAAGGRSGEALVARRRGVLQTSPMSNPAVPPPSTVTPAGPAGPVPSVPYGGPVTPVGSATGSVPVSAQGVAKTLGHAALTVTVRTIVWFIIRAIFKAIFKR